MATSFFISIRAVRHSNLPPPGASASANFAFRHAANIVVQSDLLGFRLFSTCRAPLSEHRLGIGVAGCSWYASTSQLPQQREACALVRLGIRARHVGERVVSPILPATRRREHALGLDAKTSASQHWCGSALVLIKIPEIYVIFPVDVGGNRPYEQGISLDVHCGVGVGLVHSRMCSSKRCLRHVHSRLIIKPLDQGSCTSQKRIRCPLQQKAHDTNNKCYLEPKWLRPLATERDASVA
mmetsp:Transcript_85540/g.228822  ORF Transcript_85540/g.228822 Transcript_85540/m.228822 type:complete len:239 (+) Transcript_85540:462-1178(+)